MYNKVGLYFGSFNPIHLGHMAIAGYMAEFTNMDEIWFVVSPQNPLKKKETLLDDYQRLYMVNLAIGKSEKLRACDIEFHMPQPSYTIDTMSYLQDRYPQRQFSLIMGQDNLKTLYKWKNFNQLVEKYPIYVYPRLDSKVETHISKEENEMDRCMEGINCDIRMVDAPIMEISGKFIRDSIKGGKDVSFFLPAAVWKYISEMNFYR